MNEQILSELYLGNERERNKTGSFVSYDKTFPEKTEPTSTKRATLNRRDYYVDQHLIKKKKGTGGNERKEKERVTRNKMKFNM